MSLPAPPRSLAVALVHAPVLNKKGECIEACCDEFDFFDLARLVRAYPIAGLWIVQPVPAQQALVRRLITHVESEDRRAQGREPLRGTALVSSLEEAIEATTEHFGRPPQVVSTSAKRVDPVRTFSELRGELAAGAPTLLLIGKAWGLAPAAHALADARLEPIDTGTDWAHLSVRTAAAILIDRLLRP